MFGDTVMTPRRTAEELLGAISDLSLRPRSGDRERLAAEVLRYVATGMREYRDDGCGPFVVYCSDLWEIIDVLEEGNDER